MGDRGRGHEEPGPAGVEMPAATAGSD